MRYVFSVRRVPQVCVRSPTAVVRALWRSAEAERRRKANFGVRRHDAAFTGRGAASEFVCVAPRRSKAVSSHRTPKRLPPQGEKDRSGFRRQTRAAEPHSDSGPRDQNIGSMNRVDILNAGSFSGGTSFEPPESIPLGAADEAPELEHRLGTAFAPTHAGGDFHALGDDVFAS